MRARYFIVLLAACGHRDAALDPDAALSPDGPPGVERPVLGGIDVVESLATSYDGPYRSGRVSAVFYAGHAPRWHHEAMRAGACVLRKYTPSSCTPACNYNSVCLNDVCEAWPSYQAGGRLTLTGLATHVAIEPMDDYYYPPSLPEELFADTATVTATLAGAALPAMTLSTRGVPALATTIQAGKITVQNPAGQDFVVRWTPAADDSRVRLTLSSNNQGHGLPYLAIIECDAPDSAGQIAIPAAMLDAFPETYAWEACAGSDCPPSTIRRYHRATHAVGDHDIELVVASEVKFGVEHHPP